MPQSLSRRQVSVLHSLATDGSLTGYALKSRTRFSYSTVRQACIYLERKGFVHSTSHPFSRRSCKRKYTPTIIGLLELLTVLPRDEISPILFNDDNAKAFPFLAKVTRENLHFVVPVLCYLWIETKKNNGSLLDMMSEDENDGDSRCVRIKELENRFYIALFIEPFVAFTPAYLINEMRGMAGLIAGDLQLKLIAREVIKIRLHDILTEAAMLEGIRTNVLRVKKPSSLKRLWRETTSPLDLELTDLVDRTLGTQRTGPP